jgi:uncharacterized protein (DUF488 family)
LRAHQIAYLIDVRSRPYSRYKPDFSKRELAEHLEANGIRYVFMGDTLGGQPDDPDCYVDGKVDYDKVRQKDFYQSGIARVQEAHRQQLPVVLMCSEGKPENCHRTKLIGQTLDAAGVPLGHIDENDQLISQHDVELRYNKGQLPLFGDEFQPLTSRKRYPQQTEADE